MAMTMSVNERIEREKKVFFSLVFLCPRRNVQNPVLSHIFVVKFNFQFFRYLMGHFVCIQQILCHCLCVYLRCCRTMKLLLVFMLFTYINTSMFRMRNERKRTRNTHTQKKDSIRSKCFVHPNSQIKKKHCSQTKILSKWKSNTKNDASRRSRTTNSNV